MPEYSARSYLSNDEFVVHDVPSAKHPDGASYTAAAPSAEDEMKLRRMSQLQDRVRAATAAKTDITDADARELDTLLDWLVQGPDGEQVPAAQTLLGDAYHQMVADGVRPRHIDEIGTLYLTNYSLGEQAAQFIVGQAGEALARANRADRRAAAKNAPRKSSSSPRKAGSSSNRARGAAKTRTAQASTGGRAAPASRAAASKTA